MTEGKFDIDYYRKQSGRFERFLRNRSIVGEPIETSGTWRLAKVREENPDAVFGYIPTHSSHLDQAALGLTLHRNGMEAPIILAADLYSRIPILGKYLINRMRAFPIKRNFKSRDEMVEYNYQITKELADKMADGDDLLQFAEGARSYSGCVQKPHSPLFDIFLEAAKMRKVYLFPIGVAHDTPLEDASLTKRNLKGEKEGVWDFVWNILASPTIAGNKGRLIYLDFGEPVCVNGYSGDRKELCRDIFGKAADLKRVTTSALSALCLGECKFATKFGLVAEADEIVKKLRANGANLRTVDSYHAPQIAVDDGLNMLARRHALTIWNHSDIEINNLNLIKYYANQMRHKL